MGRYRTFANDDQKDFNQYYNKLVGKTTYKYARLHSSQYNNYINPNFLMNNCPSRTEIDTTRKSIVNYKDYDTLINLSKTSSYLNPVCNVCADVPRQLNDGLQSEICYDKLYRTYNINPCNGEMKIPIIDICKEKSGIPYPYGVYNNNKKNPPIEIHSIKDLHPCQEHLRCNSYKFCKCPPWMDCTFCKYKVVTPINDKINITYTEDNRDKEENNELHNDDSDNESSSYDNSGENIDEEYFSSIPLYMREHVLYLKQLQDEAKAESIKLTQDAITMFSRSNPEM
jgi:hypothetical protein